MNPSDRTATFDHWIEEYRGVVAKVARSFSFNAADEADLRQELFLQLWLSAQSFAGQAKPSTWIYRVCLNTALTWKRGKDRRERRLEPTPDFAHIAQDGATPADSAGDQEMLAQLYAGIQALPDFDRVLVLLSLDGLAYREMAEITGLNENQVGVTLTRARKRLAQHLKGVTDELE